MKSKLFLACLLTVAVAAFSADRPEIKQDPDALYITTATAQKVAFHGATPVAQRSSANQAAVTKATGAALATTAATQTTPYGFATQAQADLLTTRINTLITDNAALIVLVNELRAALAEKGLITGS